MDAEGRRGKMSNAACTSGLWLGTFILLALLACSGPETDAPPASLPADPRLRELAILLRAAGDGDPVSELDSRMQGLLSTIEIRSHTLELDSSQQGPVVVFEFSLRDSSSEPAAAVQLFYRPDLPSSVSETYGSELFQGYPARRLAGEQIFVLAGSFEIRVFQRSEEFRNQDRLRALMALVPLAELERL